MTDQSTGIAASLAIHAACLSLFLLLPAAGVTPVKTFQISFDRRDAFLAPASGAPSSPIPAFSRSPEGMQNVKKREIARAAQRTAQPGQGTDKKAELPVERNVVAPSAAKEGSRAPVAVEKPGDKVAVNPVSGRIPLETNPVKEAVVETRFGDMDAPQFIHRELPLYPKLARRLEKEGKVVLRLFIDSSGKVLNIEVLEHGAYGFTDAAVAAIKKSSFSPARRKGEKVASRAILPVRFRLE